MLQNFLKNIKHCRQLGCGQRQQRYLSSMMQKKSNGNEREPSPTMKKIQQEIEADKKALQWRTPIAEKEGAWNSKFKLFADMEQTSDYIIMMQKEIDLRPKSVKAWWHKRQEKIERHLQQFIPERLEILGADLAAAHFLLYRGGLVRFLHDRQWMKANDEREFNLPNRFDPMYKLEAIRCDNMNLYYEGLENLRNLQHLKFISFHNVKTFDDWCLDRISGSLLRSLEVLDISGTNCTSLGFSCLYRIPSLKLLIVDDPKQFLEYELTCAMLAEAIPKLKIVGSNQIHSEEGNKESENSSEAPDLKK